MPERRPRAAPALHAERGHAAAGAVPPAATLVLGVDQAQVEVPGAMVRDVLNFAADPEVAVPGKGLVERTFDLLVDAADGVDPSPGPFVLGPRPRRTRSGAPRRRPQAEPRDRRADGVRRTSTTPYRCAVWSPSRAWWWHYWRLTVSRPGGRGTGRSAGSCRGRSGLHRAGCWLTASRGDPQDSATERKPPMAGLRARTGKGERVR